MSFEDGVDSLSSASSSSVVLAHSEEEAKVVTIRDRLFKDEFETFESSQTKRFRCTTLVTTTEKSRLEKEEASSKRNTNAAFDAKGGFRDFKKRVEKTIGVKVVLRLESEECDATQTRLLETPKRNKKSSESF